MNSQLNVIGYPEKTSKYEDAYHEIKRRIISGEFPPGTILVERRLCEMLQLSRTPIRSALQNLAQEGFLTTAPGRGLMVSSVQMEDVLEIFEIRRVLDPLALRLFMMSARKDVVDDMRQAIVEMGAALERQDFRAYVEADGRFHRFYTHYTGNKRLGKIWDDISDQEQRILAMTLSDVSRCQTTYPHHVAIFESIEKNDVEQAVTRLDQHLEDALEYHIKKLSRR